MILNQGQCTHAARHSVNLVLSGTMKEIKIKKDVPDKMKEIMKLIKFHHEGKESPKLCRKLVIIKMVRHQEFECYVQ